MDNYFCEESEKNILACMILDKDLIPEIEKKMKPEYFHFKQYLNLYEIILKMNNDNLLINMVSVLNYSNYDIELINEIVQNLDTTASIQYYLKNVKEKYKLRKLVKALRDVQQDIKDFSLFDDVNELSLKCMEQFDVLNEDQEDIRPNDLNYYLNKVTDDLENQDKENNLGDLYGLPWLDKFTNGTHKQDITILSARPSVGKTALALQIALYKAFLNKNVGIFSLEMSGEELTQRLITKESGLNSNKIRSKNLKDEEKTCYYQAKEELTDLKLQICDDLVYIEDIKNKATQWNMKNKLDYIVVDYLQLCKSRNIKSSSENEIFTHISREFKLLAKKLNIPILLLSQLNRQISEFEEPSLNHLRSCGAIEQDSDNVFFIYYDKESKQEDDLKTVYISIAKQRQGTRYVKKKFKFKGSRYHFYEVEEKEIN